MPDIRHVFTSPVADATGTVTIWNGATTSTVAASQMVLPSQWNSAHLGGLDVAASNTTYTSGTVVISGGANVTVGTNGQTITISAGGGVAIQNSQTTYTSGTVNLVDLANITIQSTTGQAFRFSVADGLGTHDSAHHSGTIFPPNVNQEMGSAFLQMASTAAPAAPAAGNKRLFVDEKNGKQRFNIIGPDGVILTVAQDNVIVAKNVSGGAITKGQLVYITGSVGETAECNLARADADSTMPCIGAVAEATIANNGFGFILVSGTITGVDTSGMAEGDRLFVDAVVAGKFVNTAPAHPNLRQRIGVALKVNASSGIILITPTAQRGDHEGTVKNVWIIGDAAAGAKSVQFRNAQTANLAWNPTAARTVHIPDAGGTIALLTDIPAAQTAISGIGNSETTYTSGTVNLSVVAGNLTIRSTTGNAFQFSASQSVQAETQTFVGGVAVNALTTYTSGTVVLSAGNNITLGSAGQTITISGVAAQTVQTQNLVAISASNALFSSGTVVLSGLGAAVVNTAAGTIRISVPTQSVQAETQTFVGGIAMNAATTYTSGTVVLSAGANITLGSAGQTITIAGVAPQSVQTQNLHNVTLAGNSTSAGAGYAHISSGTMTLAGGNNITLSQNGNAVTISAGAGGAETQTAISGIGNSETTYTSGTVNLSVLAGLLTIRSTTGNAFQFSASQSVQAETQTFVGGIGNSQTTYTSGTVNLSVVAGLLTIRSTTGNAFQFSMSQSVQAETQTFVGGIAANALTTYTSGTVVLSAGANITLGTAGQTITISGVAAQTVQTQNMVAISASDALFSSGTVVLTGLGAATVNTAAGSIRVSVPVQTNQTGGIYVTAQSTGQSSSSTYDLRTLSIQPDGIISAGWSAGSFRISATQSVQTQNLVAISASNNLFSSGTVTISGFGDVTVNTAAGIIRISAPVQTNQTGISGIANSQTTYSSGTVTLSELGAITIRSTTGNQYQFSVAAQSNQQITMFATGNTTQSSTGTSNASSLIFRGEGIASVGISGGSIVLSVPAGAPSPVNFSAGTTSGNLGSVVFSNSNGVSFGLNGSTITATIEQGANRSFYEPYDDREFLAGQVGAGTLILNPDFPPTHQFDRVLMPVIWTNASNSSGSQTLSAYVGLYTRNVSTLALWGSASSSTNFSGSGTVGSYSLYSGVRHFSIPWTTTVTEGRYWIGVMSRTTSGGANASISNLILSNQASIYAGLLGVAPAASMQFVLGQGILSVTTAGLPATIPFSDIRGSDSGNQRQPIVLFASGTV